MNKDEIKKIKKRYVQSGNSSLFIDNESGDNIELSSLDESIQEVLLSSNSAKTVINFSNGNEQPPPAEAGTQFKLD